LICPFLPVGAGFSAGSVFFFANKEPDAISSPVSGFTVKAPNFFIPCKYFNPAMYY
jgi:hypothetical protein